MIKEKIKVFEANARSVLDDCIQLCFITIARELITDAINSLDNLIIEAKNLKSEAIKAKEEDAANVLLCYEYIIDTLINELKMWKSLKDDNPSEAWNHLVAAQIATSDAIQAHSIAQNLDKRADRLLLLEQLLFPPQIFLSQGIVVDPADCECSICGQIYGECDHIKGRVYMGEMCSRIIKQVKTVREFSVVDNPGNKRCRVYQVGNSDTMTRREVSNISSTPENANIQEM